MSGFDKVVRVLNEYGELGVTMLEQSVARLDATGKTKKSIGYQLLYKDQKKATLILYGREFFETLETGRGPRKSSTYGGFDNSMLEYMQARGIGSDLSDKKRKQLARFLTLKINREGDKTFKAGGRVVYSDKLDKFVDELTKAVSDQLVKNYTTTIYNALDNKKT